MVHVLPIYKKELKSYFKSPIAAIVLTLFLIISGWFFVSSLFSNKVADMRFFLSSFETLILIFFTSAISMRLVAEEKKSGSLELLVTLPVKDFEILLGKYLAAFTILFIAILLTFPYIITIAHFGDLDGGQTFSSYLGFVLIGAAYMAIGLLFSSLTQNQIVAFLVSLFTMLLLWLLGFDFVLLYIPDVLKGFFQYLSIKYHFDSFAKGVLDTRDFIYFFSVIGISIYLATRSLASRKWK